MTLPISKEIVREKERVKLKEIIERNRGKPSSLIHTLQDVQTTFGYIPYWSMDIVAKELKIPFSKVIGVVTFYNFFSLFPKGKYTIQVCQGTACYVKGGKRILTVLEKELGIKPGQTTEDRKFSLEIVRCLGACALSPVVSIKSKDESSNMVYGRVTISKISKILANYN